MCDPFRFCSSHFVTLGRYACLVKGLFALQTETETEMEEHVGHTFILVTKPGHPLIPALAEGFTLAKDD